MQRVNSRKGQLEAIIVLGLIIVGVLVIVLAMQSGTIPIPSPIPGDLEADIDLVRDYVITSVRHDLHGLIKTIEKQGGYLELPDDHVTARIAGYEVPVWQACEINSVGGVSHQSIEEIENDFEEGLMDSVSSGGAITDNMNLFGRDVIFNRDFRGGEADVEVEVFDNEIEVDLTLPGTIQAEGVTYPMDEHYVFRLPSLLGRIHKFAEDFIAETGTNRNFEVFTISRIDQFLMSHFILTECGEHIELDGTGVDRILEDAVDANSYIHFWEAGDAVDYPSVTIPAINGRVYNDLEFYLYTEEDYEIAGSPGIEVVNSDWTIEGDFPINAPRICGPVQYYDAWEVPPFNIVIRVVDPYGGFFNFAIMGHISLEDVEVEDWTEYMEYQIEQVEIFDQIVRLKGDGDNHITIEPAPNDISNRLQDFIAVDRVCWFDASGGDSGTVDGNDLIWIDNEGDCGSYSDPEDVIVLGRSDTEIGTGHDLSTVSGFKFENFVGNERFQEGDRIYLDLRENEGMSQSYEEAWNELREIYESVTEADLEAAIADMKKMVPGDCQG